MPTDEQKKADTVVSAIARRRFMEQAGKSALAAGAACCLPTLPTIAAETVAAPTLDSLVTESLVKVLYESLTPGQREQICFAWDHQDPDRGLLRTRVANNWNVTEQNVNDDFYSDD